MRTWFFLAVCGVACSGDDEIPADSAPPSVEESRPPVLPTDSFDTGTPPETTGPDICDPLEGLTVSDVLVEQPWSEHEAQLTVDLTLPAAVAVACTLDGDPSEVHLVEGPEEATQHVLRLSGLLQASTYQCVAAPVCPSSLEAPTTFTLTTGPESNDRLPTLNLTVKESGAGPDYVLSNHQVFPDPPQGWQGQRRLVFDRDANIRWHAAPNAAGGVGVNVVSFQPASGNFTIGGAWPPTPNGRPQLIDLFGSELLYDTLPHLPDDFGRTRYHHEARELADGRLLAMEEVPVSRGDGVTFAGFRVMLVDPETDQVVFNYSSQRAFDEGHLRGGGQDQDVYHANWADVVGDVMYVGLCYASSVVAIDIPSGDWRWRFGPQEDDFALVDTQGNGLPESEYPQCLHGLQRRGNRLLVYDNGNYGRNFSRAVEYTIDEATMTATKLWDWTEPNWYQRSLGGVDYTTGGRVLIAAGHLEGFPAQDDRSTFIEIDPATGEKLWEVQYGTKNDLAYRAEAIAPCDLFANAKYCAATRARLETLEPVLGAP